MAFQISQRDPFSEPKSKKLSEKTCQLEWRGLEAVPHRRKVSEDANGPFICHQWEWKNQWKIIIVYDKDYENVVEWLYGDSASVSTDVIGYVVEKGDVFAVTLKSSHIIWYIYKQQKYNRKWNNNNIWFCNISCKQGKGQVGEGARKAERENKKQKGKKIYDKQKTQPKGHIVPVGKGKMKTYLNVWNGIHFFPFRCSDYCFYLWCSNINSIWNSF